MNAQHLHSEQKPYTILLMGRQKNDYAIHIAVEDNIRYDMYQAILVNSEGELIGRSEPSYSYGSALRSGKKLRRLARKGIFTHA